MQSQLRRLRPEEQESAVSMGYIGRMCVKKQDSKKHGYLEKIQWFEMRKLNGLGHKLINVLGGRIPSWVFYEAAWINYDVSFLEDYDSEDTGIGDSY